MLRALCLCAITTAVVFSVSQAMSLSSESVQDTFGVLISLEAGSDMSSSKLKVSGSIKHVITDDERNTFKLSDNQLKQAIGKYFGRAPDDAYLHSPTPWNDLYKTFGWDEVQTVLIPTDSKILGITTESTALKNQLFENNSTFTADYDVSITDSVWNVVTSSWETGGTFTVGQSIKYEIGFLGTGGGGETSLSYSQSWGVGGSNSKTTIVGSTSGIKVTLQPFQAVKAVLSATRAVLKARITYTAHLTGSTAVNYGSTYKDHYFWGLPIGSVMEAAGTSNSIRSTEDIEVGYYSDGKVTLHDIKTNEILATYMYAL